MGTFSSPATLSYASAERNQANTMAEDIWLVTVAFQPKHLK